VIGVLGILGVAMYFKFKTTQAIIEKEGAGKALAYEAGETGLSILGEAFRKNGRRRRRARGNRRRKKCSCQS
jgi:hypothetical protein